MKRVNNGNLNLYTYSYLKLVDKGNWTYVYTMLKYVFISIYYKNTAYIILFHISSIFKFCTTFRDILIK